MNIRVDLNTPIKDGAEVIFRSPVDCSQITGLKVYYPDDDGNTASQEFMLADAHGNNVGDIDHLFAENAVVKVILDCATGMAFVQNADTNAYLEGRFAAIEAGVSHFGVRYTDATQVVDLSNSVKMYLFATPTGYDAEVNGEGATPDFTITEIQYLAHKTEIVNRPFDGEKINRLHIGDGITSIGDYFMHQAYNLQHLSFADSRKIAHLGKNAFSFTQIRGEYDFSGLTDVGINCAFSTCPKLKGLTFSGSIRDIAEYSFRNCLSLQYVRNLTKGELTINKAAFYYCTSLQSIDVYPASTTLGDWAFMFVPTDAKTETGIELGAAVWEAEGKMCFVQNEWTQEQLTAIEATKGDKTIQFTAPESDNQGTDFNRQYGVFPWKVDGKYKPRTATASGLCGFFSLYHAYNIMHPAGQYASFYDFMEKEIVPNKIEVTEALYNALTGDSVGQELITDMNGIVSYEIGSKISATDLPIKLSAKTSWGDPGTAFWGCCEALGWIATEFKFKDRETDSTEERNNCGAVGKQLVIDNLSAGKPVIMEITGPAASGNGAHAVVPVGYDSDTDKFLIIDSTWSYPSAIMPMLYWCKFESLITPAADSAIWTFDFGEEITMAHIDKKLNTLLETVNSGFHILRGEEKLTSDKLATSGTYAEHRIACPSGAKMFVFEADESTAASIKANKTSGNWSFGVSGNFANGITETDKNGLIAAWAKGSSGMTLTHTGSTISNNDGISFSCLPLATGTYRWAAYYWNE